VVGVKREGKAEMKEGDFDIDFNRTFCPFATQNLTYKPEDFQKMANLSTYNILNNKDVILNMLNKVVKRNMWLRRKFLLQSHQKCEAGIED